MDPGRFDSQGMKVLAQSLACSIAGGFLMSTICEGNLLVACLHTDISRLGESERLFTE
jgi:hypothetical protein